MMCPARSVKVLRALDQIRDLLKVGQGGRGSLGGVG